LTQLELLLPLANASLFVPRRWPIINLGDKLLADLMSTPRNLLIVGCVSAHICLWNGTSYAGRTDPSVGPGWVASPSLVGLEPIITKDFNPPAGKKAATLPGTNAPDNVGAFRFICGPGQILPDDPIVFPGQPGRSHLHQFYGNTSANARSTYETLRASGDSTCSGPANALNRSAYWMPAMLDGKGNILRPNYVTVYYKRFPKSSPECTNTVFSKGCVSIPNGLRMIAGRDMLNLSAPPTGAFNFSCTKPTGQNAGKGSYRTIPEALAICGPGWQLTLGLDFPSCWDGVHLDSPDHRSHVGYARYVAGGRACPKRTPYFMPSFKIFASYSIIEGDDVSLWRLSSDAMAPNDPAGLTLHGDYFEGWDPGTKQEWTDNCIDKMLSCTGGNLGDGFTLKGAQAPPWGWKTVPERLVPAPIPSHTM